MVLDNAVDPAAATKRNSVTKDGAQRGHPTPVAGTATRM